jgi:uncharacterized protein (TIRG00374 family)
VIAIKSRKLAVIVLSLLLGGVCLWLASRNVDFSEAKRIFGASDWRWICVGTAIFGTDLLLRSARWFMILSHRRDGVRYTRLARGLFVGYAVNILLPARLGELFRADYTARIADVSRSATLASIFIERVIDLSAVLLIFGTGLIWAGVDSPSINEVILTGSLVLGGGMLLICVVIFRTARSKELVADLLESWLPPSVARRIINMIGDFTGLFEIVRSRQLFNIIALSVPIWFLEALSVLSVCHAVGLDLDTPSLMMLLGGASLSTLFPGGPGFVGTYQLGYVMVLRNFAIPDAVSLVASSAVQIFVMGFWSVLGLLIWLIAAFPSTLALGHIRD